MTTVCVIQARINSTRLPRKILADICGKTMLERVKERVKQCTGISDVFVSFSGNSFEHRLVGEQILMSGFDESDVLTRIYHYATHPRHGTPDAILRVTADCPLFDPDWADNLIRLATSADLHYAYIEVDVPQIEGQSFRFPEGLDCEFISMEALEAAFKEATELADREHVTPWISRNWERFQKGSITPSLDYSGLKWSVDTQADLDFVRAVYKELSGIDFRMNDVIDLLTSNPELLVINGQTWRPEWMTGKATRDH